MFEQFIPAILAVALILVVGIGAWLMLRPDPSVKRDREPPPWDAELPTRRTPLPLEVRILEKLGEGITPKSFTTLRLYATDGQKEWEEFWEVLQRLEAEGKVIRVANATEDESSMWDLPPTYAPPEPPASEADAPESEASDAPESDVSEDSDTEWESELAGGHEPVPPSFEDRILDALKRARDTDLTPIEFKVLRNRVTVVNEEKFWAVLQVLLKEGKVVRVADATDTSDSLWDLPSDAEEGAE